MMTLIKRSGWLLLLTALLVIPVIAGSCSGKSNDETPAVTDPDTIGYGNLSAEEIHRLLEERSDLTILDIRTPDEFNGGHLANAVNIDFYSADFETRMEELDRDADYVLYCRSGNRSAAALKLMKDMGFDRIYHMASGINDWISQGYPLAR